MYMEEEIMGELMPHKKKNLLRWNSELTFKTVENLVVMQNKIYFLKK